MKYLLLFFASASICFGQAPGITFKYHYPYQDGIPNSRYKERREQILASLSPKSAFIAFAADVRNRQNDVDYEYRQNSNLWYLTGMPDEGSALLLVPDGIVIDGKSYREIIFVRPRTVSQEAWTGVRMGIDEVETILEIEKAIDATRLQDILDSVLVGRDTIFIPSFPTPAVKRPIGGKLMYMETDAKNILHEKFPELYIKSPVPLLAKMREIKDADELRLLKKAIDISAEGHIETMKKVKPGMKEYEIEAIMEYTFKRLGAEDVGYPSIVGSDYNACILHYISNRKQTQANDMVLADCGAEYQNYTADITRTFPVNGKYTPEQRKIYSIVLEAQDSGIVACRVGNAFREPHNRAMQVVQRRLMELEIISKPEEAKWYFNHGTSHYLGLDVHDAGTGTALKPNSVITVEPGIYIPEGSPCNKKWWNIGVRIEDDILITEQEPINLSGKIPRKPDDIEKLMQSKTTP
jgi:Xaa-Pro aminopeptidase